ncbi:hypothetical protein BGX31_001749 [Mortierella sp. GBA43]|nr:hypothetical protein BGX31_001749 [Mortierella sp. GBA43]
MLQSLLSYCTNKLEELDLDITISHDEDDTEGLDRDILIHCELKRLKLIHCVDKSALKAFWPCLWEQYGHLEQLEIMDAG